MSNQTVLIIGGSLAGLTLANLLGAQGIKTIVIDRAAAPEAPMGDFRPRVSAINRASENILDHIGCWQDIAQSKRCYLFDKVHVEHEEGEASIDFDANRHGLRYLGHMVENDTITHALYEKAIKNNAIELLFNTEIRALSRSDDGSYSVEIADKVLTPSIIVGADGARSWLRSQLGVPITHTNYQQRCIVGYLTFKGDLQQTAWQRFLRTGPLGLLPLSTHHASLAWSCDNAFADTLLALDDDEFCQRLTEATNGAIGLVSSIDHRAAFPLHAIDAEQYVIDNHCVLIGDAAHAIHPLAGLGANLGILDAATLAEEMIAAKGQFGDAQLARGLKRYERRRKPMNALYLTAMSSFNRFFGDQKPHLIPARPLREALLRIGSVVEPAKGMMMRQACGLTGDLPEYARPKR